MWNWVSKVISQAYPPKPAFTEETIPDLNGKVSFAHPPTYGRNL